MGRTERGYLLKPGKFFPGRKELQVRRLAHVEGAVAPKAEEKPVFNPETLARIAKPWRHVDLVWLADRSDADPALVDRMRFLEMLYRPGEHVRVFTKERSQGQALWPCDREKLPETGPLGVWFLAAPVDGREYVNPRVPPGEDGKAKMSGRSEESVTSWRWMMLESDEADTRDWLGCIVQMPLRIAALYTSGGRSVHALIRVDARTKEEWDGQKDALKAILIPLGVDPGAWSAVRLTRLPGCWREGKLVEIEKGVTEYRSLKTEASPRGAYQKLLYINPDPQLRPICDAPRLRDTEKYWLDRAALGVGDADEDGGSWLEHGLWYYSPCSKPLRAALAEHRRRMKG